ncbi:MAG: hypothetical protein HYR60_07795 [Acidobacteria bacterium]|nr:hypothetical protein [Acidobacteriota bacterium]MBI3470865.1 hypothetical protein [Candidatus Solibacter usitatus]
MNNDELGTGIALVAIGGVWLLHNLGLLEWYDLVRLWPLGLIAAGVYQLLRPEVQS